MLIQRKHNPINLLIYALLLVMLLFTMTPIIFMITASMMTKNQILRMPFNWIPESLNWINFKRAIVGLDENYIFLRNILNSLIVSITVAITTVLLGSLTGYGLAKFRFRGRNVIFIMIMATMMIPFEAIMIPLYMVVMKLRIQNTYVGLILPFLVSAFGIFQMRQYFSTFPTEFLDAARVDGMGELGIYWQIVLPNAKPVIATLSILAFRSQWDNLLWPLLVSQRDRMKTIPQYITAFAAERNTDEGAMMAAALIASIPMFVLFMSLTKYFIGGSAVYESRKG
jgi:multiple sugar transport system permease protein